MATRATYEIDGQVFYCHYDGYPAGAMERFGRALRRRYRQRAGFVSSNPGGMPFAFIRGAWDAQPAAGHECHGDTEFRYICYTSPDGVSLRIDMRCFERNKFYAIYNGSLAAAVNLYTPDSMSHRRVWNEPGESNRLMTAENLQARGEWMSGNPHYRDEQARAYYEAADNARSGLGTAAAYDEIRHNMQLHHLSRECVLHMAIHHPDTAAAAAAAE